MEGFIHSILGMNIITPDQERSETHHRVKEMNHLKKQAQNRYKPDPHRKNIFEDQGYFYKRCQELEVKIKKLERANKYLIQQVIDTTTLRSVMDSRKPSESEFQLETGISIDSGSGDKPKGKNIRKKGQSQMRTHVKDSLLFNGNPKTP